MTSRRIAILDGPVGTELAARGVATELPLWSAAAIESAPAVLGAIHAAYRDAGADVHTAATFRTQPTLLGARFESLARGAVRIARASIGAARLAGSVAPVADCYRPDLSPGLASRGAHRALARVLADAGVDLLLCETFPVETEALVAVEECLSTGLPTWLALTAGPDADLLTPAELARIGRRATQLGAEAVLVNCVPASVTRPYVAELASAGVELVGAYANAGHADDAVGWCASDVPSATAYLAYAREWVRAGAAIVGSCCGTTPAHIAALASAFHVRGPSPRQPR